MKAIIDDGESHFFSYFKFSGILPFIEWHPNPTLTVLCLCKGDMIINYSPSFSPWHTPSGEKVEKKYSN